MNPFCSNGRRDVRASDRLGGDREARCGSSTLTSFAAPSARQHDAPLHHADRTVTSSTNWIEEAAARCPAHHADRAGSEATASAATARWDAAIQRPLRSRRMHPGATALERATEGEAIQYRSLDRVLASGEDPYIFGELSVYFTTWTVAAVVCIALGMVVGVREGFPPLRSGAAVAWRRILVITPWHSASAMQGRDRGREPGMGRGREDRRGERRRAIRRRRDRGVEPEAEAQHSPASSRRRCASARLGRAGRHVTQTSRSPLHSR